MTPIVTLAGFILGLIALRLASTYIWTLHRRYRNDPTPRPVLRFLETMRQYLANESDEGEGGTAMTTYSFTIILAGFRELTAEIADALHEAGCDDSSPGSCDRVVSIRFDRESASLGDAVGSAVNDVERAGYKVVSIEIDT
jgi:hypothetical protein